jgi:hypothetical protein
MLCLDHGALHAVSLLPFFSHFTHETYVQTVFNHSTKFIPHSTVKDKTVQVFSSFENIGL